MIKNMSSCPSWVVSVGWSMIPYTKRLQVQFLVRAHTQGVGLIASWGPYGRQLIDVPLSHLSLSQINKNTYLQQKIKKIENELRNLSAWAEIPVLEYKLSEFITSFIFIISKMKIKDISAKQSCYEELYELNGRAIRTELTLKYMLNKHQLLLVSMNIL